jgi:hypothetical protein
MVSVDKKRGSGAFAPLARKTIDKFSQSFFTRKFGCFL